MTFLEFKKAVYAVAFPQKESQRLEGRHDSWIVDALIEAQLKIKCLQSFHREYINLDATYFSCGATAFPIPPGGKVQSLAVQNQDNTCKEIEAVPYTESQFRYLFRRDQLCACTPPDSSSAVPFYGYAYDYLTSDPELRESTPDDDLSYSPTDYAFATFENNVWLWPRLNSNRTIVLKWTGVKRHWTNASVMSWEDEGGGPDRDVQSLVVWRLLSRYYEFDQCDPTKAAAARGEFFTLRRRLILECRRRNELPEPPRPQLSC